MIALGLMSGTSADGIDAVMLELTSVSRRHEPRILGHAHRPYPARVGRDLLATERLSVPRIAELGFELAELYAQTVRALSGWRRAEVCGMHGQTIWHAPPPRRTPSTLQIGSSAVLAQRLGLPVVADLRGADIALGGQGAPIVPFAHWFFTPPPQTPRIVVNFGGICNFTYVADALNRVLAYDVGPGMMLSDAFARLVTHGRMTYDRNGVLSRAGSVIEEIVDDVSSHPFIRRQPPKSTGREDFGRRFFEPLFRRYRRCAREDVARSLLAASARILARAIQCDGRIPRVRQIVLSGGGSKNPVLVAEVRACLDGMEVCTATTGPLAPQHHEPAAVALIAARTLRRLPSSLPSVTGASHAALLGHIHHPTRRRGRNPVSRRITR